MVLEEAAQVGAQRVLRPPRLGDEHQHGMVELAAGRSEQLQRVVETSRVAARLVDDRQELLDVVAQQVGLKPPLARAHPVHVAAQGVDLAVVGQVAEGLGQLP